MKKMQKICLLSVSVLSLLWIFLFTAMDVSADTKDVKIRINEGTSSCTWQNVHFWTADVKSTEWTTGVTTYIDCSLMKWTWQKVTYQVTTMTWQTSSSTIPSSNLKIKWWTVTQTWSLWTTSSPSNFTAFGTTAIEIYSKAINKIWVMHETLSLQLTIPAWQAPDLYQWSAVVTVQ